MNSFKLPLLLSATALILSACATPPVSEPPGKNMLTTGQIQLSLKKDETTQTEVIEAFGAPNLVTTNSEGEEVWTYQRNATVVNQNSSSTYGTVILFGGSSTNSGFEQSNRSLTLIIKFKLINGVKRISSFDSRSSSF